jgi:hypothetical protein
MSILWTGSEDTDFPVEIGNPQVNTSTARSGYCRVGIQAQPIWLRSATFSGGAITSFWLSFITNADGAATAYIGVIKNTADHKGIYFGISGTSGNAAKAAVYKWDGTTETKLYEEAGYSIPMWTNTKIDVQITDYGATADIRVYIGGSANAVISQDNVDISISAVSDLDAVCLMPHGNNAYASEIIVADEDTRTFSLVTIYPTGAGDTEEWDGAYSDVDEYTISDADIAYTNVVDENFQTQMSNLPSGSFAVKAVHMSMRACKSADATPTGIHLGVRSGSSDDHAAASTMQTYWYTYKREMATNPITSAVWSQGEIDALQLSLRSD